MSNKRNIASNIIVKKELYMRDGWEVYYNGDLVNGRFGEIAHGVNEIPEKIEKVKRNIAIATTTFENYQTTIQPLFTVRKYPSRYDSPCTYGVVTTMTESRIKKNLLELRPRIEKFYSIIDGKTKDD